MKRKKIVFFRAPSLQEQSTEILALNVLNDPNYDDNPYIDKKAIQRAFDQYGHKLNPFNSSIYENLYLSPNVEGRFLAQNMKEIESMVVDEICSEKLLYDVLKKNDDITHIGLTTYANGIENGLNLIQIIQSEFSEKELYVGGIGVIYPHIQKLVNPKNICIGNGVNWLREKFELKPLSKNEFQIPKIYSTIQSFPIPSKAAYIVTQMGCPFSCDFCITTRFLKYNPFSNSEKIINYIEDLSSQSKSDCFVFLCEPNGFFPEHIWKKVFDYFIKNRNKVDNQIFIYTLTSLKHLQSFNLSKIQNESALKILAVNFGIESTLEGGYEKNKGITNKFIRELNNLGITTFHNFILGLPYHTKETIDLEIKRNFEYDSVWYSINTFKPYPLTPIYEQLKRENRIYGENLPPEFLYREGFFPFEHKYLGGGFNALEYAFKAYYECEKRIIDPYNSFADVLLNLSGISGSRKIKQAAKILIEMGKANFPFFKIRMSNNLINLYQGKIDNSLEKLDKINLS